MIDGQQHIVISQSKSSTAFYIDCKCGGRVDMRLGMQSRFTLLGQLLRSWRARVIATLLAFVTLYQFACDQFGAPTLPNLYGMTGAYLPWWGWLVLLQCVLVYGIFEYVRRIEVAPTAADPSPLIDDQQKRNLDAIQHLKNTRDSASIAVHQGTATSRAKAFHEMEAAMQSISDRFGIEHLAGAENYAEHLGFVDVLATYVSYVDTFYPLLRDGYVQKAQSKASTFKNPFRV